jgi:hypothetical protein
LVKKEKSSTPMEAFSNAPHWDLVRINAFKWIELFKYMDNLFLGLLWSSGIYFYIRLE